VPRRTAFIGAAAAAACLATGAPAVALQPGVTPHQRAVDGSFFNTAPEPAERGTGISFQNEATGDFLTPELLAVIKDGAIEGTKAGPKMAYPMDDVAITLLGATWRDTWSKPLGFKIAASIAVREATALAGSAILEPIMEVEITVPDEHVGEIIGGVNSRRGRIEDIADRQGVKVIAAMVPLQQMFGYSTELRSLTQGRGVYSMRFSHYDR